MRAVVKGAVATLAIFGVATISPLVAVTAGQSLPRAVPSNGVVKFGAPCAVPEGGDLLVELFPHFSLPYYGTMHIGGPVSIGQRVPLRGNFLPPGDYTARFTCQVGAPGADVPSPIESQITVTAPLSTSAPIGAPSTPRRGLRRGRSRVDVPNSRRELSSGSMYGQRVNAEMVALAVQRLGKDDTTIGYWLTAGDGGVFSFGTAPFFGSAATLPLRAPIVDIAATHDSGGYWLLGRDGGVFTFGDAPFLGSAGSMALRSPAVALLPTDSGMGYWIVLADGGVLSFGDAPFRGSAAGRTTTRITAATPTAGNGYILAGADGSLFTFGSTRNTDAVPARNRPVVAAGDEIVGLNCPLYYGGPGAVCDVVMASGAWMSSVNPYIQGDRRGDVRHAGTDRVLDVPIEPYSDVILLQRS